MENVTQQAVTFAKPKLTFVSPFLKILASFCFVLSFSQHTYKIGIVQNLTLNGKSIDGVLGIRTRDHRMIGADESTELCRVLIPTFVANELFVKCSKFAVCKVCHLIPILQFNRPKHGPLHLCRRRFGKIQVPLGYKKNTLS